MIVIEDGIQGTAHKILPTLYKKAKTGKTEEWVIGVYILGITPAIVIYHGLSDGKKQTNVRKVTEGKNQGRSNETSPLDQALSEAQSDWSKKKDKGYRESLDEISEVVILPMLAHKYKEKVKYVKYPCAVQRKYDGTRCLLNLGTGLMLSRGGKEFKCLPHIPEAAQAILQKAQFFGNNQWLDGELYSHDLSLQQIGHVVKQTKKPAKNYQKIHLRVYDTFDLDHMDMGFQERYRIISMELPDPDSNSPICLAPSEEAYGEDDLLKFHEKYVAEGYEGLIIRNYAGIYLLNHRSTDLLKLKGADDDEYEIIGFKQGEGIEEGCVVWSCVTKEGKKFDCRPIGTRESRRELFKDAKKYLKKMLTVTHEGLTDEGAPKFPVGKAIRDYE